MFPFLSARFDRKVNLLFGRDLLNSYNLADRG
jgi:hypothetical protein